MAEEIYSNPFECPGCKEVFNFTHVQKLQHASICKKKTEDSKPIEDETSRPSSSNQKLFKCPVCNKQMHLSNVEILKHKKSCKIKVEPP